MGLFANQGIYCPKYEESHNVNSVIFEMMMIGMGKIVALNM